MESLLMSIALKYGKGKITDASLNYAAKLLGIDQQQQNPKYTFGMPFTDGNISLNPKNMLKKSVFNKGVESLISGSAFAPLALGAGAVYFLNKNREKLTGYDTQQAYEDARTERIANKRLDKITDRMTSGKNYGNYEEALLDSGAGAVKIDDVIMNAADYFPEESYKDTEPESIENITRTDISDRGRGQDNVSPSPDKSSPSKSSRSKDTSKGGQGTASYGRNFHARRGGIASL